MGDIAEYYRSHEENNEDIMNNHESEYCDQMEKDYSMGALKWQTKSGSEVLIQKMTNNHLMNTIDWLKKKKQTYTNKTWSKILMIELEKR